MVKILIGGHLNMLVNFGKLIQIILNFLVSHLWMHMKLQAKLCDILITILKNFYQISLNLKTLLY